MAMELITGLKEAIEAFLPFKRLGGIGLTKARNRIVNPYRVEKLSDDFFNAHLKINSTVTVKGVLSRYAPTYRPLSYLPTIPSSAKSEVVGQSYDLESRLIFNKKTLTTKFRTFQFPVQALPPIKSDVGVFCIAYLYPESMNSFILDQTALEKGGKSDNLIINDSNRPIPVLVPEVMLENCSEAKVTLTGVISLVPDDISTMLTRGACDTRSSFYQAFHRPSSVRISFCIDCRNPLDSDIRLDKRLESLPAAIYVEGHFEGVIDEKYREEFRRAVPNIMDFDFGYEDYPGKTLYLTSDPHVSLIGSKPSVFGFYTETDLVDARELDVKVKGLQKFYTDFRKSAGVHIKKKAGVEVRFKPDFLFDWRRQGYFHPDGALVSKEIDEVLKVHAELAEVTSWLGASKGV